MKSARHILDGDRKRIEEAVAAAEAKTSAEIVPVIATASGRYDRAEDIAGLWIGAIAMAVAWILVNTQGPNQAQWGPSIQRYELLILLIVLVAGFLAGAVLASQVFWIRRAFTPKRQMQAEVEDMAAKVFFDHRIHHTQRSSGLLIYISLYERTAKILADSAVLEKLGKDGVDHLCADLINDLRKTDIGGALCAAIAAAGARLGEVLPAQGENVNELSNALILIE